jgi:pyruvate dehydrogenase phosphatase
MRRRTLEIDDLTNPYATRKKVLQLLTPEECTLKLRSNEESYLVSRGNGVYRYDVNQLASNDPIEDDRIEQIIAAPNPAGESPVDLSAAFQEVRTGFPLVKNATSEHGDWMFWGIFDGHVGWYTSDTLKRLLIPYVVRELSNLYQQNKIQGIDQTTLQSSPSSLAVDKAIQRGFTALDDDIVLNSVNKLLKNPSKRLAADILLPAHAGSCALLTFLDSQTGRLKVACTGDSRAILGRRDPKTGKWTVDVLSVDQTGRNLDEANRLRKEHPGEENEVVRRGRVLGGLEPTRAVSPLSLPFVDDSSATHGINSLSTSKTNSKNTGVVNTPKISSHPPTSPPNPSSQQPNSPRKT